MMRFFVCFVELTETVFAPPVLWQQAQFQINQQQQPQQQQSPPQQQHYDCPPNSMQQQQQQQLHLQEQQVQRHPQLHPKLGNSAGPLPGLSFIDQPRVEQPSKSMSPGMPPGIGPTEGQQAAPGCVDWATLADAPFSLSSDRSGNAAVSSGMPLGAQDNAQAFSQQQQLKQMQQQQNSSGSGNSYLHPTGGPIGGGTMIGDPVIGCPMVDGFSTGGGGSGGGLSIGSVGGLSTGSSGSGGVGGTQTMPNVAVRDVLGLAQGAISASAEGLSTLPSSAPVAAAATAGGRWTKYLDEASGRHYWHDGIDSVSWVFTAVRGLGGAERSPRKGRGGGRGTCMSVTVYETLRWCQ